ncbi:hypothetical protein ACFYUY_38920 [Kitasatospora sp. NPDC004745]|uniref:hypothetical protein n=1 Tax=Kitasatospora sp. NPDC004745 TaxID=3364019 RepID=UPI00369CF75E
MGARTAAAPRASWLPRALMTTGSVAGPRPAPTTAVCGLACVFRYIVRAEAIVLPVDCPDELADVEGRIDDLDLRDAVRRRDLFGGPRPHALTPSRPDAPPPTPPTPPTPPAPHPPHPHRPHRPLRER